MAMKHIISMNIQGVKNILIYNLFKINPFFNLIKQIN